MMNLSTLSDDFRPVQRRKRVGRGPGSGLGKTCGRGEKGAGARSGYKRRYTYEGGQFRTFMKIPQRGFSNVQFQRRFDVINLRQIERLFEDGDIVNLETLRKRGFLKSPSQEGLKILGDGELTKRVTIHAMAYSDNAKKKLSQGKFDLKLVSRDGSLSSLAEE